MTIHERLQALNRRAADNAQHCIFPFWTSEYIMDRENGGFYSRVTRDMERLNDEPRSLVLIGRMVYAFSGAYQLFGDKLYAQRAEYTFRYLMDTFYDRENGGAFNQVAADGTVADSSKPLYSEAFFVMACAAFYRACGSEEALRACMEAFETIEGRVKTGPATYPNNLTKDWAPAPVGQGRMAFPAGVTMFPHHLCQAYQQLYAATGDAAVLVPLREMAECVTERLYDDKNQWFSTIFDADGKPFGTHQSFGHDCELSYLAMDIAAQVGDSALSARMEEVCRSVLYRVLQQDFDPWHSLYNDMDTATGAKSESHVWWAQAEAVTAMLCGYQYTGDAAFLQACEQQLDYIEQYFVDKENGDWHNNVVVDAAGWRVVDGMHGFDKLNGGKCPFHNSHMCFEVIQRTGQMLETTS